MSTIPSISTSAPDPATKRAVHAPDRGDWPDEDAEEEFKPLTAEEARQWRARHPGLSVVRALWKQIWWAAAAALLVYGMTRRPDWTLSLLYGAASVVVPTAVMAVGLGAGGWLRRGSVVARATLARFFVWEGAKLLLAMAMLWSAPRLVPDLNWLALLAGLLVVLKAYVWALWTQTRAVGS